MRSSTSRCATSTSTPRKATGISAPADARILAGGPSVRCGAP
jgi:hypothetical protein